MRQSPKLPQFFGNILVIAQIDTKRRFPYNEKVRKICSLAATGSAFSVLKSAIAGSYKHFKESRFMFCENCGHQVREGERFCEACGAPLQPIAPVQPAQQSFEQPVQPVQQSFEQPVQQNYTQPPTPFDAPTQQYEPVTVQPAPKQPMSKKTKMIILFSGIGAAVLAAFLIVLFTVIIPAAKNAGKLDIKDYITVKFNVDSADEQKQVTDGKISGQITPDYEKFFQDQKLDPETGLYDNALYEFYSIANVRCEKTAGDKSSDDYGEYFYNAKQSDVFTVTIEWPNTENGILSESYKRQMERYEQIYGVGFKTENQTFEIKLADALSAQSIAVIVPQEADVLGYIKQNNLIETKGSTDGNLKVSIKEFDAKIGDFSFKHDDGDSDVDIYDKDGKYLDYFYLEFSKSYDLKNGDKVTLNYEKYSVNSVADSGVALTGSEIEYTVKSDAAVTAPATTAPATTAPAASTPATTAPAESVPATTEKEEGLTAAEATANANGLKEFILAHVAKEDDKAKASDKIEVKAIYYCHSKDSSFRRIVFIYENTTGKYFRALESAPEYMSVKNGKIETTSNYFSASNPGSTLAEATENNWYLSETYSKYYNNTKVL